MIKSSLFALISVFLNSAVAGDWIYIRPEIGAGYSDNVYQDDLNKKSDFFLWLQVQSKYGNETAAYLGRVNLSLYSVESPNNSLNYSLRRVSELNSGLGLTLGLGGFSYLKADIGSTDEAFNNYYLLGFVTKRIFTRTNFELNAEPGIKVSAYPQLSGRNDIILFGRLDGFWRVKTDVDLNPYFELGFVFSNQAYYVKNYVDIGAIWSEKISEQYKYNVDFSIRSSSYPNRTVSDILFIPNRKGRNTATSLNSSESLSLTQLSTSVTMTHPERDLSLGLNYTSENSLSNLEYFTELQLLASALFKFE